MLGSIETIAYALRYLYYDAVDMVDPVNSSKQLRYQ